MQRLSKKYSLLLVAWIISVVCWAVFIVVFLSFRFRIITSINEFAQNLVQVTDSIGELFELVREFLR